jgi:RimJ/RimL family protein N-acetyltransferase
MRTLQSERLILRPFREEDLDDYASMMGDAEVRRFLGSGPLSREDAWREMAYLIGHAQLRGFGFWAVEDASGRCVGRIGFNQPEGWPGFELGWMLARPYWGRGYATEGAHAALSHAFDELGRDHVISLILPENRASIRVAERIGETLEGSTEVRGFRVSIYGIRRR